MIRRPLALAVALMLGGSTAVPAQQPKSQERPDAPSAQRPDAGRSGGAEQRGPAQAAPGRADTRESRTGGRQESSQLGPDDGKAAARKQNGARGDQRQPANRERANRQENRKAEQAERKDRGDSGQPDRRTRADKSDRAGQANSPQQRSSQKNEGVRTKQESARTKDSDQAQPPMKGKRTREDSADNAGTPQWNDDQQRRVRESFQRNRTKLRHHTNVNVDISIGRRAPRNWTYYAVPTFVVEIAPRYRGYRYAWVDNRYVIVHPTTYVVVAYIDAGTGRLYASSSGGSGDACTVVDLSTGQRQRILAAIDIRERHDLSGVRIGFELPGRIVLRSFPTIVRRDFGRLANCRYVALSDGRIAVVAPRSREIVAILDR